MSLAGLKMKIKMPFSSDAGRRYFPAAYFISVLWSWRLGFLNTVLQEQQGCSDTLSADLTGAKVYLEQISCKELGRGKFPLVRDLFIFLHYLLRTRRVLSANFSMRFAGMTFGDLMWESSQFFASDGFACSRWFVISATFKHGTNQCLLSWHFLSFPEGGPGNSDSSQGDTPDSLQIVGGHYVAPYVQYTSHIENPSKVIHTNTMRTWIAYKGIFWTKRSHISE